MYYSRRSQQQRALIIPQLFGWSCKYSYVLTLLLGGVSGFWINVCPPIQRLAHYASPTLYLTSIDSDNIYDILDLTQDGGVVVMGENLPPLPGDSDIAPGTPLIISYRGTLAESDWTTEEVVKCWLQEQQGLDELSDAFVLNQVSERVLTDTNVFTEDFVVQKLGMENASKIKIKKLVMAAKRLTGIRQDYQVGMEFDSNDSYSIEWDVKPKLIPGMERALTYMIVTGLDHVSVRCRSDYAYGAEGYRKRTGEVLVPPYASMLFEIDLVDGPNR